MSPTPTSMPTPTSFITPDRLKYGPKVAEVFRAIKEKKIKTLKDKNFYEFKTLLPDLINFQQFNLIITYIPYQKNLELKDGYENLQWTRSIEREKQMFDRLTYGPQIVKAYDIGGYHFKEVVKRDIDGVPYAYYDSYFKPSATWQRRYITFDKDDSLTEVLIMFNPKLLTGRSPVAYDEEKSDGGFVYLTNLQYPPNVQNYLHDIESLFGGNVTAVEKSTRPEKPVYRIENAYEVEIGQVGNDLDTETYFKSSKKTLEDYLVQILRLTTSLSDSGYAFDVIEAIGHKLPPQTGREMPWQYRPREETIYLIPKKDKLEPGKIYRDKYYKMTVSRISSDVIPYLNDVKYCEKDSDCTVSMSFCSYGGFNNYRVSTGPYGCSVAIDVDGPRRADGEYYRYGSYGEFRDPDLNCFTEVTYNFATCISNQCKGQERKVSCQREPN